MNFKTTLILLVLVVLLAGTFLFVQRRKPPTIITEQRIIQEAHIDGVRLLPAFNAEDVTKLQFVVGGTTIVVERDGQDWWQTQPVRYPLDDIAGPTLVDAMARARYVQRLEPGKKGNPPAKDLSLDPPLATITLHEKDRQHVVHLGRRMPGQRAAMMLAGDERVYVANDVLYRLVVEDGVKAWRSRLIPTPIGRTVDRVTIKGEDHLVDLVKTEGDWFFASPEHDRVSADSIDLLMTIIRQMRLTSFVQDQPDDLKLYGLDQPQLVLSMHTPEIGMPAGKNIPAAQITLTIGGATDFQKTSHFATISRDGRPGQVVVTLGASDVQKLQCDADFFRERRLVRFTPGDVVKVRIDRTDAPSMELVRSDGQWAFGETSFGFEPDHVVVSQMLEEISQARIDSFAPVPEGEAEATVRLQLAGRLQPVVLSIYPVVRIDGRELRPIVRSDEAIGCLVPVQLLRRLFASPTEMRDLTVASVRESTITRIVITRQSDDTTYTFERTREDQGRPGTWSLTGHEQFEREMLEAMLPHLFPLRAEQWLDPAAKVEHRVTLQAFTDEGVAITLHADPLQRQAVTDPAGSPFTLHPALAVALQSEFRHRTVLSISVQDIRDVTLHGREVAGTILLSAQGMYMTDNQLPVDQTAASILFDLLSGLRVDRYIKPSPDAAADKLPPLVTVRLKRGGEYRLMHVEPYWILSEGDSETGKKTWFLLPERFSDELLRRISELLGEPVQ